MAVKLTSKPNTIPPNADYPFGDIRDRDGITPGTPVSREVYADMHQFFERLMFRTDTIHNDLPDNDYSGFQLFEAFVNAIRSPFRSCVIALAQTSTSPPSLDVVHDTFPFASGFTANRTGVGRYTVTASLPGFTSFNNLQIIPSAGDPFASEDCTFNVEVCNGIIFIETRFEGNLTDGLLSRFIIEIKDWDPRILE
jgi:hypothetical protein